MCVWTVCLCILSVVVIVFMKFDRSVSVAAGVFLPFLFVCNISLNLGA